MVRYCLSISAVYSPELFALYKVKGFKLQSKIKDALRSYVAGEPYIIDIPEDLSKDKKGRSFIQLTFAEKKDKKVIAFLESIPKGERSDVIRQITMAYFSKNICYLFFKQQDEEGRRVVLAAGEESTKATERDAENLPMYVKENAGSADGGNERDVREGIDLSGVITEPVMDSTFDLFAASESLMGEI